VKTGQDDKSTDTPKPDKEGQPSIETHSATGAKNSGTRTIESFLVAPGIAGPFENGMNVNDAYAIPVPGGFKLVDLQSEGNFTPALEIRTATEQKSPTLVASIWWVCSRFSIYGISVRDARYRTREGLGVGSTLGDLRRHFKIELPLEQSEEGDLIATIG